MKTEDVLRLLRIFSQSSPTDFHETPGPPHVWRPVCLIGCEHDDDRPRLVAALPGGTRFSPDPMHRARFERRGCGARHGCLLATEAVTEAMTLLAIAKSAGRSLMWWRCAIQAKSV